MAKLFIQHPEGDQLLTELDRSQTYLIGRSDDCSICIPADSISGHHAQLTPTKQGWVLDDLGSSNGTRVNGQTVKQSVLANGTQILLGDQIVLLFSDEPAEAPATAAAAQEPASKQEKSGEKKPKHNLKVQGASEEDLKLVKAMSVRSDKIRDEIARSSSAKSMSSTRS